MLVTESQIYKVDNVSDNIYDIVNDCVSDDKGFISKNNEVHDGSTHVNEGVTKYASLSKRSDKKSKKRWEI